MWCVSVLHSFLHLSDIPSPPYTALSTCLLVGMRLFPPFGSCQWCWDSMVSSSAKMPGQRTQGPCSLNLTLVTVGHSQAVGHQAPHLWDVQAATSWLSPWGQFCPPGQAEGQALQQAGCGLSVSPLPSGPQLLAGALWGRYLPGPPAVRDGVSGAFQNQLLTKGMVILRDKIRFYEGECSHGWDARRPYCLLAWRLGTVASAAGQWH